MKKYTWEVSDNQHCISLWDHTKAIMTKFCFRKSKKLSRNCSLCAFAVERTICDSVLCDGGYFVARDSTPKTLTNPSDLNNGHAFNWARCKNLPTS